MKHKRHNIVCTHPTSRRPTQEGSAATWSRTRDKSPLSAALWMLGLPWMREAAAACNFCKRNEIGARMQCSGGKQHLGCSLALLLLPNLSLPLCFSSLLLALLLLRNLAKRMKLGRGSREAQLTETRGSTTRTFFCKTAGCMGKFCNKIASATAACEASST